MSETWWDKVTGDSLQQGDVLPQCQIPRLAEPPAQTVVSVEARFFERDVILLSQSCDLVNNKLILVATTPIYSVAAWQTANADFKKPSRLEEIRKGRIEGLHLLGPHTSEDNMESWIVDFREIHSLAVDYARRRATELVPRYRLKSPYLEHFSQAFARFFMRVGLPAGIAPFK